MSEEGGTVKEKWTVNKNRITEGERKENGRKTEGRHGVVKSCPLGLGRDSATSGLARCAANLFKLSAWLAWCAASPPPIFPNWRHVRNGRKTEGERKGNGG